MSDDALPLHVYGVVRSGRAAPEGTGIDGQPLELVEEDGLAALTSRVPAGPLVMGREQLLAHQQVLERAFEDTMVLPMRFGVVLADEEDVRQRLLRDHGQELATQLDELDGTCEVRLRGVYDEGAVLAELVREDRAVADLRSTVRSVPADAGYYARIRLGELVAEGLEAKQSADGRAIVERLAPLALAIELGNLVHEHMVVNASFLVGRDRLDAFDEAVDDLGRQHHRRIHFSYVGPLPPHSFAELSMAV